LLASLKKAPLDLQWSPSLYAVSADHMLLALDTTKGQRVRTARSSTASRAFSQGRASSSQLRPTTAPCVSGTYSSPSPLSTFALGIPVAGVVWSADGASVYCVPLDDFVHVWDVRKNMELVCLSSTYT
jgi:hypothetical protein